MSKLSSTISWDVKETDVALAGTDVIFEGYKALTRSDNDGQLAIVKKSYSPFTNEDLIQTVEALSKITGMPIEGYQELKDGRRVLGFLKNTENFKINGFPADNYILVGNTHDLTSSIFFGASDTLIRCMNQWSKILATMKVRHSSNKSQKMAMIMADIEQQFKERKLYYENLERFGEIKISQKVVDYLVKSLLDIEESTNTQLSTRKQNQIFDLEGSIKKEMKELGNNMWGLFNGVTHYTTHKVKTKGGNSFGNLYGKAGDLNQETYDFGLDLIKNKGKLVIA